MIRRYAEMRPEELAAAIAENPLFLVPWGALEWHGAHLPLGLDGIVAEHFCERLAEATEGILLPCFWLPMTTLPHAQSIQIPGRTVAAVWQAVLDELARVGAKTICLISGHYAQGHEIELYHAAEQAMLRHEGVRILAASPLEVMLSDEMLDHAGQYETAQLLAIRPDLVRLDLYEEGTPAKNAVLGNDPRKGTEELGRKVLSDGVAAWKSALELWDLNVICYFYAKRRRSYREYQNTYFRESWEQAIADWWKAKSGSGDA